MAIIDIEQSPQLSWYILGQCDLMRKIIHFLIVILWCDCYIHMANICHGQV